ncbi:MAG: hypothetical protein ACI8PZ_003492 [Myxococcota bacterium]|jgi:hypothetical protein
MRTALTLCLLTGCSESAVGWRSALYPDDWAPGFAVDDAALHDFSYAGYHNGPELPDVVPGPTVSVLDHGADPTGGSDSTAAIQAAIDAIAPTGGVVWLPAGEYRVDDLLEVTAPGTVLRGDGPDATFLWFTRTDGMTDRAHLTFRGAVRDGAETPLVSDAATLGTTVEVDSTDLEPGDDVALGWVVTDEWVDDHGMTGTWTIANGAWRGFFRRTVLDVDRSGDPVVVTLDVPHRYDALLRDSASLRVQSGTLREVGVQGLSVSTVTDWDTAWTIERSHAILFDGVADGWVADVASFESPNSSDGRARHLMTGGVKVLRSKRVTVAETDLGFPQNRGEGGSGYLYEISQSSDVLTRDAVARNGRHNFIQNWDFGTTGCVWLRTHSEGGRAYFAIWDPVGQLGYSEFHHSLAMANLIDASSTDDGWQAANRHDYSTGAGITATGSVFWNTGGTGKLNSWQFGLGYVIGTGPDLNVSTSLGFFDPISRRPEGTAPEDWLEGEGTADLLMPQSLYDDQLSRRR